MEQLKKKNEKALHPSPKSNRGFTLIELLIAMSVGLVLLGAMYGVFTMHNKIFNNQEQIAEMQQNARAAMDMMTREIRMAGYDPSGTMSPDPQGIPNAKFVGIPYDADELKIYADLNGDSNADVAEYDEHEYIKYTIDSDYPFEIRRNTGGGRQEFALNIQSFTFEYLNSTGSATITTADIRQIRITIIARTARPDPDYAPNGGYRTYTLTSIITPRNLGL